MTRDTAIKWLVLICRMVLGVIFLWASYDKIVDPPDFAHMIYNYKLTPGELINLLAIFLPWIECLAGLALITGVGKRGAIGLVVLLLVMFIGALSINLATGHAVDCGCFSSKPKNLPRAEMLADMRWRILEDAGMLLMAVFVLIGEGLGKGKKGGSGLPPGQPLPAA